jgi:hypothetical protein
MELSLTDGIAGLALLVSVLSAVSASNSANSSERSADSAALANHLAQHNERLTIYKSLQKFNFELHSKGNTLPDEALWSFFDAANISEFYYPQRVSKDLLDIADAANRYLAMRDLWKSYREPPADLDKARAALVSLNEQGAVLRKMCKECDESLRAFLRMEPKAED